MTDELTNNTPCPDSANPDNVNEALRTDSENLLRKELTTDSSTQIVKPVPIAGGSTSDHSSLPDAEWLNEYAKRLTAATSPVVWTHHQSEIQNVNNIIRTILWLIVGISSVTMISVVIFGFMGIDTGAIISAVTGILVDGVLGILVGLFNTTLKSKKSYFDAESDSSKFDKMLLLVQTISDQSKKDDVISAVVRKHFNIPNN